MAAVEAPRGYSDFAERLRRAVDMSAEVQSPDCEPTDRVLFVGNVGTWAWETPAELAGSACDRPWTRDDGLSGNRRLRSRLSVRRPTPVLGCP
jgi:hypothetical protein